MNSMDPGRFAHRYQHTPFIAEAGMHSVHDANSLHEIVTASEFADLGKLSDKQFAASHPEIISHFAE